MERVYAAVDLCEDFKAVCHFQTFGDLVNVIVRNSFVIAGVLSFLFLIFGGFNFIVGAGAGDTKKLEQGQKAIVGAITGLIIVVGSFWIVQIVEKVTGIPILNPQ